MLYEIDGNIYEGKTNQPIDKDVGYVFYTPKMVKFANEAVRELPDRKLGAVKLVRFAGFGLSLIESMILVEHVTKHAPEPF